MGVTLWIVLAFALGVLFGRMTSRGSGKNVGGPTGVGGSSASGPGFAGNSGAVSGLQFGQGVPTRLSGNPDGAYRVVLLDRGPNIINTIKAVRAITRLGLKEAKDTVESAPVQIIRVDSAEQAQAIARSFQGVATVRVDGPAGATPLGEYGYAPGAGSQHETVSRVGVPGH